MNDISWARRIVSAWSEFWFRPANPLALDIVRVAAGVAALAWLGAMAAHVDAFFGLNGWFDRQAYVDAAQALQGTPRPFGWSLLYLIGDRPEVLRGAYFLAMFVVLLFTLGVLPRVSSVGTWLAIASFGANPASEADDLVVLNMLSLYLVVGYFFCRPAGQASLIRRLIGPLLAWPWPTQSRDQPSVGANLGMRLAQVHFAIIVVTSGLQKLQFGDWWAGVALWYPLHRPLETSIDQAFAHAGDAQQYLRFLSVSAYLILAWQLAFPTFAWRRSMQWLLFVGAVAGGAGLIWLYRMPVLAMSFFAACLTYVPSDAWSKLAALRGRRAALASQQVVGENSIGTPEVNRRQKRQRDRGRTA